MIFGGLQSMQQFVLNPEYYIFIPLSLFFNICACVKSVVSKHWMWTQCTNVRWEAGTFRKSPILSLKTQRKCVDRQSVEEDRARFDVAHIAAGSVCVWLQARTMLLENSTEWKIDACNYSRASTLRSLQSSDDQKVSIRTCFDGARCYSICWAHAGLESL